MSTLIRHRQRYRPTTTVYTAFLVFVFQSRSFHTDDVDEWKLCRMDEDGRLYVEQIGVVTRETVIHRGFGVRVTRH